MYFYRLSIEASDDLIILKDDSSMDGEQTIFMPAEQAIIVAKEIKRLANIIIKKEQEALNGKTH